EEWGGIAYALAGLDATLGADWEIVPLIKIGRDMQGEANGFLRGLRRVGKTARFIEVPVPNNRVVLRYESRERRCERMEGGVPAWTWTDLGPLVRDLDAIYLNFISGFELCLGTAQALRHGFQGPIYADLHSLFLGMRHDGIRTLRPLPESDAWFRCFDVVQLNEDELRQLSMDPLAVAAEMLGAGVSLLVVTLGAEGAIYVAAPGFASLASRRPGHSLGDAVTTARVEAPTVEALDPTGCGDVFGAALCAGLLQGARVEPAIAEANRLAARNAAYRGASHLSGHLRGELVTAPVDE
ncbi:MAG: carbohydrate kinase family protein, partial [Gemmatimonadales bacterium]|nr:carbohydrate kinase family protein [Gemmatimonadales bacterium]